jgi:RHS repeat-associated protein
MNTGGAAYYFHHDALDTTAALTKSTAAVEWTYTYDPYGNTRTTTKVDPSAPANPIQYTGELLDSETALYDLRARTYNPQNGGFLSTDPLTPDTDQTPRSLYLYANAEPLLLTDPTGQYAEDEDPNGNTTILTGHPCPAGGGTWYQDPTECRDTTTAPSPNPGAGGGNTDEGGSAGEAGGRSTSFQPAADEPGGDGVPPELGDPIQPPKPVEDGVAAGQRYETSDGAILEMTPYAANRATGRRVTATEVTQALSYPPREFWQRTPKPGQWRIGYYDPIRRTFVSREQGRIVNVIQPVTKGQYNDIMRRRPTRGR